MAARETECMLDQESCLAIYIYIYMSEACDEGFLGLEQEPLQKHPKAAQKESFDEVWIAFQFNFAKLCN